MSGDAEIQSGLEGVVAFATQIAEPDRDGGALRYRGVDIEDLVGTVAYERVWGLLVDGAFEPGLEPGAAASLPVHSGDARVDLQAALALLAATSGARAADRHRRRSAPATTSLRSRRRRSRSSRSPRAARDLPAGAGRGSSRRASGAAERFLPSGAARPTLRTRGRSTPTGSRRPSTA